MALVDSLLTAIVRADGDALVMHVGERPYVVASSGPIELSAHGLNLEAMSGMLGQLLPADTLRALREFGAIEHELDAVPAMGGDRFTVVAARGGDDIWIEVRRHRRMKPASGIHRAPAAAPPATAPAPAAAAPDTAPPVAVPEASATPNVPPVDAAVVEPAPAPAASVVEASSASQPPMTTPAMSTVADDVMQMLDAPAIELELVDPDASAEPLSADRDVHVVDGPSLEVVDVETPPVMTEAPSAAPVAAVTPPEAVAPAVSPAAADAPADREVQPPLGPTPPVEDESAVEHVPTPDAAMAPVADVPAPEPVLAPPAVATDVPVTDDAPVVDEPREAPPAQVVPLRPVARADVRVDAPPRSLARHDGLERLLRLAVARGASALYLTSQAPPALRTDGEVQMLSGEPPLTSEDVEAAILEILPEGVAEGATRGEATEWIRDLPEIGRVRCTTFRDYRGPGALLRMISARAASAEQLGLSREIQALATETEGLVLVSGPRGSGKSTLVAAVVDLINRQRADYVVTLERQIRLVHESRHSLISQREVRGHGEEVAAAARAALRENPDVLVIEDVRSPEAVQVALDAAGSGLLVVMSVTAAATTAALERLVDMAPADRRAPVQAALAETLRGAVAQVLLRKAAGGRVAARELLLNTAAVARLLAEGQLSQVPRALDGGRKHGMTPLNDALVSLVQGGVVDIREAYRKAADREGLLAQLKRAGFDTSFVERLA